MPISCSKCGEEFRDQEELMFHEQEVHSENEDITKLQSELSPLERIKQRDRLLT